MPVVGFDPGADGFFWCAGQGGTGIQTSPAMATLTTDLISGEAPAPPLDGIAPNLSPQRFVQSAVLNAHLPTRRYADCP